MKAYLTLLIPFQRLFIPGIVLLTMWALWRAIVKRDLAVGLVLYIGLVVVVDGFLNTGIYLPGLEKGSIRYSEACAVFLLFHRPASTPAAPPRRSVTFLLWIYFTLLFVSALRSVPMISGIFDFRRLIVPQIVALLLAKRGLDSPEAYRRFYLGLSVVVLFIGLFTFWDLFFDRVILKSDMLENGIYSHNRAQNRFGSFFLNPNYLGAFIGLVFPPLFVWALEERRPWHRLFAWSSLLSLAFSLVETQSRAALLAFGMGLFLLILGPSTSISRPRRLAVLALFVAAFTAVMPGFFTHAVDRFDEIDRETSLEEGRSRSTTWRYTMRMIADHPVAGIGFGESQFSAAMTAYGFEDEFGVQSLDAPHNSYLQAAVYAGIPALLAFVLANLVLLGRTALILLSGRGDRTLNATTFGFGIGVLSFLASIYPDLQLFTLNVAPVYWVFFGLLLSQVVAASARAKPASAPVPVFTPRLRAQPALQPNSALQSARPRIAPPRVVRP